MFVCDSVQLRLHANFDNGLLLPRGHLVVCWPVADVVRRGILRRTRGIPWYCLRLIFVLWAVHVLRWVCEHVSFLVVLCVCGHGEHVRRVRGGHQLRGGRRSACGMHLHWRLCKHRNGVRGVRGIDGDVLVGGLRRGQLLCRRVSRCWRVHMLSRVLEHGDAVDRLRGHVGHVLAVPCWVLVLWWHGWRCGVHVLHWLCVDCDGVGRHVCHNCGNVFDWQLWRGDDLHRRNCATCRMFVYRWIRVELNDDDRVCGYYRHVRRLRRGTQRCWRLRAVRLVHMQRGVRVHVSDIFGVRHNNINVLHDGLRCGQRVRRRDFAARHVYVQRRLYIHIDDDNRVRG